MTRRSTVVAVCFALGQIPMGCATPDPCNGQSGACLTIHVEGAIGTLTALRLDFSGAIDESLASALPANAHTTPFVVGVLLPDGLSGSLALSGIATNGGATVALGMTSTNLEAMAHAHVTLMLHPVSGASCQDGVRDGDETDVDCGGACPRCANAHRCGRAEDCLSATCEMNRCAPSIPSIVAVSPSKGPTTGGVTLRLTGSGFVAGLTAKVDGIAAMGVTRTSATEVTFILPPNPGAIGTASIALTNPDGTSTSNTNLFSYYTDTLAFAPARGLATGAVPFSLVTADFNRDGKPDLAVAAYADSVVDVLLGNGDGTFAATAPYHVGMSPNWVAVGDFNKDGITDLTTANEDGGSVSVLLGDGGDGTFRMATNYPAGTSPQTLAIGDWNHDDNLDLAVALQASNEVLLFLGQADGTFVSGANVSNLAGPLAITAGDWNGDGKPDLAVVNDTSATVQILLGLGDGTFFSGLQYTAGMRPYSVTAADLDGDRVLDLAVANAYSNTISVLLGKGDGTFAPHSDFPTDEDPAFVTTADLDGDGALDLLTANESGGDVSILHGNGDGSFAMPLNLMAGVHPESIAVADFNGDGRPDLAVVSSSDSRLSILLNTSQ